MKTINALNKISNKLINLSKYNLSLIPKCSNERTRKTVKVKSGKFSQIKEKKNRNYYIRYKKNKIIFII